MRAYNGLESISQIKMLSPCKQTNEIGMFFESDVHFPMLPLLKRQMYKYRAKKTAEIKRLFTPKNNLFYLEILP